MDGLTLVQSTTSGSYDLKECLHFKQRRVALVALAPAFITLLLIHMFHVGGNNVINSVCCLVTTQQNS